MSPGTWGRAGLRAPVCGDHGVVRVPWYSALCRFKSIGLDTAGGAMAE
jgi:hypothetical protein